jgi:aminobenzoyl-glutamate utilization protein B
VVNVAKGAALMTGTELEIDFHSGISNLLLNDTIIEVLQAKMQQIGAPQFSAEETRIARELAETFPKGSDETFARLLGGQGAQFLAAAKENLLVDQVLPLIKASITMPGSTDVGDVSWVTPTGQIQTTCQAFGTPGHSWQLVAQSGTSIGHKGMIFAGKVLAETALEFMRRPDLLRQAQTEFENKIKATPYKSLIPDGARPPIHRQTSAREFAGN